MFGGCDLAGLSPPLSLKPEQPVCVSQQQQQLQHTLSKSPMGEVFSLTL